jgi:hypothetical protein
VSLQSLQYVTNLNTPGSLQRSEAYWTTGHCKFPTEIR